ncbi:hypothetical protein IB256_18285 [Pseudomonas sp. PDM17]|uniref:hypothetical protein n=1 Tax=Pseudomonas sp. PDM17 TaxID=2769285 RepID=UPI00177D3EB3|nr:hypothetical protein [Pseudomonas sp. PDM17]MBD9502745.1 hypothetical protein [Pseudomonas sp. PDM17]
MSRTKPLRAPPATLQTLASNADDESAILQAASIPMDYRNYRTPQEARQALADAQADFLARGGVVTVLESFVSKPLPPAKTLTDHSTGRSVPVTRGNLEAARLDRAANTRSDP